MAKFLNKKEQVIDLKLTSYGHYLFSVGRFKPEYYAFFDSNILYDKKYANGFEKQNDTVERIKNETEYVESLVLFEDVEDSLENSFVETSDAGERYFSVDVTPTMRTPREDNFKFSSMIGDAKINSQKQLAPAWKVVVLNGEIMSSSYTDVKNDYKIPQVNIHADYILKTVDQNLVEASLLGETDVLQLFEATSVFQDQKSVALLFNHPLIYVEELNTDLLNDNFDIEVFEIKVDALPARSAGNSSRDLLTRKYFPDDPEAIMGGMLTEESQIYNNNFIGSTNTIQASPGSGSVEYYFDLLKDYEISPEFACKAAEEFNKQTQYVSLDFDCSIKDTQEYNEISEKIDIYGQVTEPEICP
tara:strand:- start:1060 stop:2136 length:1077 start_codon:yes stop_codon:yes gene_type:complete